MIYMCSVTKRCYLPTMLALQRWYSCTDEGGNNGVPSIPTSSSCQADRHLHLEGFTGRLPVDHDIEVRVPATIDDAKKKHAGVQ